MFAASAIRTASAVGADTATIGAPIAADFCTISTETRLVSSTMPSLAILVLHQRAGELVERVMTADILSQRDDAARRVQNAAA